MSWTIQHSAQIWFLLGWLQASCNYWSVFDKFDFSFYILCSRGWICLSIFIYLFFKHRKPVLDRLWFQPDRNLPCEWCISLSGHIWRTWSAEGHCSASTEGVGIFNIYSYSVAIHNTVMYEVIKVCKNKNMLKCSMHSVYKCSD